MKKYVLVILVVLAALLTACAVKANTNPSEPQTEVNITREETCELVTDTTKKESVKERFFKDLSKNLLWRDFHKRFFYKLKKGFAPQIPFCYSFSQMVFLV